MLKLISVLFLSIISLFGLLNADSSQPDWGRFTEVVITEGLDEPMKMAFLPNKKILIIERKGGVKVVDEKTNEVTDAGFIHVNTKYTNKAGKTREAEEGLMGLALDPNYAINNFVYLYYAHPKEKSHVLTRFVFKGDSLHMASEKLVLTVPTQREECCHTGGGMTWDKAGNLFLTTGNNTVNPKQGSSNLVETAGLENEDDQRAAGSTNDLRGKILRIHPEAKGGYSIPAGNLFPVGTAKTKPEIYTMGHRNPWRVSRDTKTGYIYWGEVGPDATKDSTWGPRGYDEFNQAKGPGFFGWPYFIGNNKPYRQYNSATATYGEPFDAATPVNNSVNNTGLNILPKPVPAMLYYPYGASAEFPEMGTSGRSATGGPVFRKADFKNAARPWPDYFEGKWLITEFMRGWIMAVTMDENGDYKSMERVIPEMNFSSAIDMEFGPSGDMYVLEYGSSWFKGNENSKLVRIEYNAGNRKPAVALTASKTSGALPLTVSFNSEGTADADTYDNGKLSYKWTITDAKKAVLANLSGKNPNYVFNKAGDFVVTLLVTDTKGARNSQKINITAGNSAPELEIALEAPNQTFYFNKNAIAYKIKVKDTEDGNNIKPDEVAVTFDFIPQGFDPIEVASKHKSADDLASYSVGRNLIESSDCKSCHQYTTASIGPSYKAVAEKYSNTPENMAYLVKKIKEGGSGVWGEHGMAAHPDLSEVNAKRITDYIFSLNAQNPNVSRLALNGEVKPESPSFEKGDGRFVLRAAYKDKGTAKAKAIFSEQILQLKPNILRPQDLDYSQSVQLITTPGYSFSLVGDKSYGVYKNIDLSSIKTIIAYTQVSDRLGAIGGYVEARLGSPNGELIATSNPVNLRDQDINQVPDGVNKADWTRSKNKKAALILAKEYKGKHDIYLVFRNEKAKKTDVLLQLSEVGFFQ